MSSVSSTMLLVLYGWFYGYFGQNLDERMKPQRSTRRAPAHALGAHNHLSPRMMALPWCKMGVFAVALCSSLQRNPTTQVKLRPLPARETASPSE
jgi:hypothetical protein